jgi:hypothetical protein
MKAWIDSHERITSAVGRSPLLTEITSVSKALSDVADVGLACLRALHTSETITREEREAYTVVLEMASVPRVEVTLAIIPGIRILLEAVERQWEN